MKVEFIERRPGERPGHYVARARIKGLLKEFDETGDVTAIWKAIESLPDGMPPPPEISAYLRATAKQVIQLRHVSAKRRADAALKAICALPHSRPPSQEQHKIYIRQLVVSHIMGEIVGEEGEWKRGTKMKVIERAVEHLAGGPLEVGEETINNDIKAIRRRRAKR